MATKFTAETIVILYNINEKILYQIGIDYLIGVVNRYINIFGTNRNVFN